MFKGSYVALVTPFKNGRIDEARLKWLVDYQIDHQTDGLVPCGTTGESPTLSYAEHKQVVEIVVRQARGRVPVLAGTGSNSTEETLDLTHHAAKAGAQGALLVVPYYNKPTPRGLYAHFRTVARSTKLPLVIYNIPSRSGVAIPVETLRELAWDCPTVVGLKDASGTMSYTSQWMAGKTPKGFSVLSGDDALTLPLYAIGGSGVISVLANLLPRTVAELCRAWTVGNTERARRIHEQLYPLMRAAFLETNPIPVKAAMAKLGLCRDELRLPLVPMSAGPRKELLAALKACPFLKENGHGR